MMVYPRRSLQAVRSRGLLLYSHTLSPLIPFGPSEVLIDGIPNLVLLAVCHISLPASKSIFSLAVSCFKSSSTSNSGKVMILMVIVRKQENEVPDLVI